MQFALYTTRVSNSATWGFVVPKTRPLRSQYQEINQSFTDKEERERGKTRAINTLISSANQSRREKKKRFLRIMADETFPEADAVAELNPGLNKDLQEDSTPAEIAATSKDLKEQADIARNKKFGKDGVQKLKSAIIISGVVVAVIGAIFAINKKLREK